MAFFNKLLRRATNLPGIEYLDGGTLSFSLCSLETSMAIGWRIPQVLPPGGLTRLSDAQVARHAAGGATRRGAP